eukprot:1706184-Pyramimonas_sp.AAC.1
MPGADARFPPESTAQPLKTSVMAGRHSITYTGYHWGYQQASVGDCWRQKTWSSQDTSQRALDRGTTPLGSASVQDSSSGRAR